MKKRNALSLAKIITTVCIVASLIMGSSVACFAQSSTNKIPETPSIAGTNVNGTTVTVKWSGANRATNYQVAIRSQNKSWHYLKKVKKTESNRKKYTKKGVYKVIASGSYYKVYKYRYSYKVLATLDKNKRSYNYTVTDNREKYVFAVRGSNTHGKSAWRASSVRVETSTGESVALDFLDGWFVSGNFSNYMNTGESAFGLNVWKKNGHYLSGYMAYFYLNGNLECEDMYPYMTDVTNAKTNGNTISYPVDLGTRIETVTIECHKGENKADDYIVLKIAGKKKTLYRYVE